MEMLEQERDLRTIAGIVVRNSHNQLISRPTVGVALEECNDSPTERGCKHGDAIIEWETVVHDTHWCCRWYATHLWNN